MITANHPTPEVVALIHGDGEWARLHGYPCTANPYANRAPEACWNTPRRVAWARGWMLAHLPDAS